MLDSVAHSVGACSHDDIAKLVDCSVTSTLAVDASDGVGDEVVVGGATCGAAVAEVEADGAGAAAAVLDSGCWADGSCPAPWLRAAGSERMGGDCGGVRSGWIAFALAASSASSFLRS